MFFLLDYKISTHGQTYVHIKSAATEKVATESALTELRGEVLELKHRMQETREELVRGLAHHLQANKTANAVFSSWTQCNIILLGQDLL